MLDFMRGRGARSSKGKRDRWVWLSLIPYIGACAPIIAGVRRRVWWWTALGLVWTGAIVASLVLAATETHQTQYNDAVGWLIIAAWVGGIVTSFAIRRSYDRRGGPVGKRQRVRRPWPAPTERSRQWTIRYALVAYVATFVGTEALGLLLRYPLGIHFQVGVGVMLVDACLLAALIPLARRRGLARQDLGLRATKGLRSMWLVILALFAYIGLILLWAVAFEPHETYQKLAGAPNPSTINAILAVIALSASAPIVEEIFFRGLLYRSLRNKLPIIPAALIAGCLFGLVHITSYPLVTLPVKAAFGVIACLLYERTGSLLPGIALHAFVDATVVDFALSGNNAVVLITSGALIVLVIVSAAVRRSVGPRTPGGMEEPAVEATPSIVLHA